MKYSQECLENMAAQINLYEYAEKTVEFTKHSGNVHYCECIFHNEKTASLAFFENENTYYCFGCGAHGNIYNWLQKTEHLTFPEAVEKVSEMTGTEVREYLESESVGILKEINKAYTPPKVKDLERTYLDLDKDYDQKFSDELPTEWINEGITKQSLRKYDIRIDNNANRIVYPVLDDKYRLIGIKGRTRYENFKTLKLPKYINYNKIGTLDFFTGMKWAEESIKQTRQIIILEGLKSVMKLDGWGIHNCVSAETSDITEQQLVILIKMGIKTAVIAFDEDVSLKKVYEITRPMKRYMNVEVVINKGQLLKEKMSPTDLGEKTWELLYKERKRI